MSLLSSLPFFCHSSPFPFSTTVISRFITRRRRGRIGAAVIVLVSIPLRLTAGCLEHAGVERRSFHRCGRLLRRRPPTRPIRHGGWPFALRLSWPRDHSRCRRLGQKLAARRASPNGSACSGLASDFWHIRRVGHWSALGFGQSTEPRSPRGTQASGIIALLVGGLL